MRPGDELLGTSAALMQVGVGEIIAPVTIVPDSERVTSLMVELHRQLIAGRDAGRALVAARVAVGDDLGSPEAVAALSFLALRRLVRRA